MKTTIILFLAITLAFTAQAQSIKYKNTSITITCDGGFGTIQNEIRYNITSDIADADTLQSLFSDKEFKLSAGKLEYAGMVSVPSMWDIIEAMEIEQVDVGKKLKKAIIIWSTNIIYAQNLLGIDQSKWTINN